MHPNPARCVVSFAAACLLAPICRAQWMSVFDETAAPVCVESATISTEITGQFAVTTFDLIFRNQNARQLEGTFEFPLLDGQTVTRFALDLGGVLREAVPVPKERGRVVFEEIERRRVDPGLLEQTAGNNYRARVFPLPPLGTRHIVIAYEETLSRAGGAEPKFRLALNFPRPLERFVLRASVHGTFESAPKLRSTLGLALPPWTEAHEFVVDEKGVSPRGVFEISLPKLDTIALTTQRVDAREYFFAEAPMPVIAEKTRPAPKVVGLLWDASGSGKERDHAREFAFLDRWFASVRDVDVRLVLLRDTAEAPRNFRVKGGHWWPLRDALRNVVYDGATSFDGLADDSTVNEWLLFSDGLVNYGATATDPRLPFAAPVHVVLASARADAARLRGIAARHGGEFVDLNTMDAASAAARVRTVSVRVLAVEHAPEEVAEIFPEPGSPISGDAIAVTGVLRDVETSVRVRIGHSAEDAREIEIPLRPGAAAGSVAARAWASAKINALSLEPERNRDDIRRTSEAFGIVTADTSLIVLENVWDYARFAIAPPADLRAEWERWHAQTTTTREKERDAHMDYVVAAFAQKQRWWEMGYASNFRPLQERPWRAEQFMARREAVPSSTGASIGSSYSSWPVRTLRPDDGSEDEIVELSPFTVTATNDAHYTASQTLAGSRTSTRTITMQDRLSGTSRSSRRARDEDRDETEPEDGDITLQPWSPESGYLDRLERASIADAYSIYLEERGDHRRDPGFYLDVAGFFFGADQQALALRILSNLAELQLEDAPLLRVLGQRLMQAAQPALALPVFERVLRIRGEEPQSRRDLALACAAVGQYQRAINLLWEVVSTPWHDRFPDIELIALGELNAIAATCGENLDLSRVDARLRRNLDVGLRVALTWDSDNCDIDLWVDDPDGERAFYDHPLTHQGGLMSRDFTGGYGPEEFLLHTPKPGKYTVRINYYADRRNAALGPVTVQVRFITGFGTPGQKEERTTLRLARNRETLVVGAIEIPGAPSPVALGDAAGTDRVRRGPHAY